MRLSVGDGDAELNRRLNDELDAHNVPRAGAGDQRSLSVRATDDSGELVGGLQGWTWAEAAGWEMVWVRDDLRGTGLGRRLLETAEAEALSRGCVRVFVSSFTFQAPRFYERAGYVEFARSEGLPLTGSADVHFAKSLAPSQPPDSRPHPSSSHPGTPEMTAPGVKTGETGGKTVMWEAKAAPGREAELLAFAAAHAPAGAQLYRSADARVVIIDPTGSGLPDVPDHLVTRPPHAWPFERVQAP